MPANHRLGLDSADDSIWKRVVYAPFAHKIQPSEEIQDLNSKIADELPGILAWAVAGAVAFMSGDRSFPTCQAVTDATARARNAGDPIENWITDNVQTEPETFTNRKEIYEDFVSYQQALGLRFQWKMSTLHEKLIARGIVLEFQSRTGKLLAEKVNNGERLWKGLRLKTALDHRAEEARAAAAEIPATVPEAWVDEMLDEGIQFT
jgi:putative DNA primase/helicase